MLIFVGTYLVLSCSLGVFLGRIIKYGMSAPICTANQGPFAHARIFHRAPESVLGSRFRTFHSQ